MHCLVLLLGFLFWLSVHRAAMVPDSSIWLIPIIIFSFYMIFLCLAAVLVGRIIEVEIVAAISLFSSLIFAYSLWHFSITAFCAVLVLSGIRNIHKDLELNVKVDLWKSLGTAKSRIILALAIMVSSQYLFMVKGSEMESAMIKLDLKPITSEVIGPVMGFVNPNFKKIQEDGITVDQFIIESQKQNTELFAENEEDLIDEEVLRDLPEKQREEFKQEILKQITQQAEQMREENLAVILESGREELSQMVGRKVAGDENITDVFAGFVDERIDNFFQPQIEGDGSHSSLFVYIMTVLLFLTILPLGSIIMIFCFVIAVLAFKLLLRFGIVSIEKMQVEREVIVSQ